MSARRTTARFSLATALVAGLALVGAVAPATAVAETGGLWSASTTVPGGTFVQLSKVDASATALGTPAAGTAFISVEVVDGVGYAIGYEETVPHVYTWDIATGAVLTAVAANTPDDVLIVDGFFSLDARVDGTLLAYARLDIDGPPTMWLVSVDPVTGLLTPIADLELLDEDFYFEGIATNPIDGVTYLLVDLDDGLPGAVAFDFDTVALGAFTTYPEIAASLGGGYFSEGDFDEAGVLWFTYGDGVARSSGPLGVGVDGVELGAPDIESKALAVTGTGPYPDPAPQLAATGLELAPVAGGAAVLLALGGALLIARRRAQA